MTLIRADICGFNIRGGVRCPRLVRCWRGPCPHGARKSNLKDHLWKMPANLCWIYDLPMTYWLLHKIGTGVAFVGWAGCFACRSRFNIERENNEGFNNPDRTSQKYPEVRNSWEDWSDTYIFAIPPLETNCLQPSFFNSFASYWGLFNGVVSAFQTKVCISTVPWIFECVHSTGVEFRATVVSNLCSEVAPPLIAENGVVKHQNDVNHFCKYFYVLLRNKQLAIWYSQNIPTSF